MSRATTAHRALRAALLPALVAVAVPAAGLHAQGFLGRMKAAAKAAATEAATRKAEGAARSGTEQAVDAATAKAAAAVGLGGSAPAGAKPAAAPGPRAAAPQADAPRAARSTDEAWANYDFTPGTRPLFVDDFAADNVGDFPKRLKWDQGSFEVVEYQGARWLRATSFGWFGIPLPEALPERFTLELDMIAPSGWGQEIVFAPKARGNANRVAVSPDRGGVYVNGVPTMAAPARSFANAVIPLRVHADGQHVKVYMGETRVANIPQMDLGRDRLIRVGVSAEQKHPALIGNVRVMAGGKALYDALAGEGRVATQGIRFMTNDAALLEESVATLKEIAAMLNAHPELRLTIEGHTDNVGNAGANQALSEARAAAVKAALVERHGVAADRLEARGFGASKPAQPNGTAEGRAANRRVELVRR
jgi:outer membrane protein OmpA-like peptidoglycan-associated protein